VRRLRSDLGNGIILALDLYAEEGDPIGEAHDLELAVDLPRANPEVPATPSPAVKAALWTCNHRIADAGFDKIRKVVYLP
jgi:hypothetical protein